MCRSRLRMNSESPFRVSKMVLTIGCILCGITAGAFLLPKFRSPANAAHPLTSAVNLQQSNFSEFENHDQNHVVHTRLPIVTSTRPFFHASGTRVLRSTPPVDSIAEEIPPQPARQNRPLTSYPEFQQSISTERRTSQYSSAGDPAPYFYAPVTVHPVTVNIDNSGVIREISRINDRLDALTAEPRTTLATRAAPVPAQAVSPSASIQPATTTNPETAQTNPPRPMQSRPLARRFEYTVHDDRGKKSSIPPTTKQVPADAAATNKESVPRTNRVATRLPSTPPAPRKKSHASDIQFFTPDAPLAATPEPPKPELLVPEPPPVPVPAPAPVQDVVPQQPVHEIPLFEPSAVEPSAAGPESVPELEFSAELFSIPEPTASMEIIHANTASIEFVSKESWVEETATCTAVTQVHSPELSAPELFLAAALDAAKRTTDVPFMNGLNQQNSSLTSRVENITPEPMPLATQPMAPREQHIHQPDCRHCNESHDAGNPTYRIKAVTPPQALQRITSLFW